jgi:hypothetical protein
MQSNKFDLACRQCSCSDGVFLMDCFCVLCFECYSALGREVLGCLGMSIPTQTSSCKICLSPTEFESEDLCSLSQDNKLLVIANRYLANMYIKLKQELFVKQMDSSADLENRSKELECEVSQEKGKTDFYKELVVSLKNKFRIQINDIPPKFYFKDKFRILADLFKDNLTFEERINQPEILLEDTKRKENRLFIEKSKANDDNSKHQAQKNPFKPFEEAPKVNSFSAFKHQKEQQQFDNRQENKENREMWEIRRPNKRLDFQTPCYQTQNNSSSHLRSPSRHIMESQTISDQYRLLPISELTKIKPNVIENINNAGRQIIGLGNTKVITNGEDKPFDISKDFVLENESDDSGFEGNDRSGRKARMFRKFKYNESKEAHNADRF